MRVIKDELLSPLSVDKMTVFSMRPPELLWIREPRLYFNFFSRESVVALFDLQEQLHRSLKHCAWLDGFCFQIYIRCAAIEPCMEYAWSIDPCHFDNGRQKLEMIRLLKDLQRL
jgi:hypothetical protein